MRGLCGVVVGAFALAGYSEQNLHGAPYSIGELQPLPPGPIGFHCATGVKQWPSDGGWIVWSGPDPNSHGGVCIGTNAAGGRVQTALGVLSSRGKEADSLVKMSEAVEELASKPAGSVVKFTVRANTTNNANVSIERDHFLRVLGAQDITIPAGNFHTIVVEENYTNSAGDMGGRIYAFTFVRWVDADTGMLVKSRSVKWDSSFTDWTTTKVEQIRI